LGKTTNNKTITKRIENDNKIVEDKNGLKWWHVDHKWRLIA
jgi:hypothetical protein